MKIRLLILTLFISTLAYNQEVKNDTTDTNPFKLIPKMKLFIDSYVIDMDYMRKELNHFDFVRDQKFADVHIKSRVQQTGSGGIQYELEYMGVGDFKHIYHKYTFFVSPNDTESEIRDIVLLNLTQGLMSFRSKHYEKYSYLWEKQLIQNDSSSNAEKEETVKKPVIPKDKWNNWVFNLGMNGSLYGQETSKNYMLSGNISVKQVKKKNKFSFRLSHSYNKSVFTYGETDITSIAKTTEVTMTNVISISDHWSVGAFADAGSSTYSNWDFYYSIKPAIEYSIFDYEVSTKKKLTVSYMIGFSKFNYVERTIFDETDEIVWEHQLSIGGSVNQTWGNIYGNFSYEAYLKDKDLYALNFNIGANLRIISGLSFNINGNYSITNNQINLAGGDLSLEELLLRQQQVKSGYNFMVLLGFSYSFGSMFSSIVNPRFGF